MEDIEQLQYGGLTDNQDKMSSLGDMKTELFFYIKYLLDMFKYLINSYKNDKYKLSKIVESFNETFETDFITKYDLIKEFGDIVNKNPGTRNRNIVLKNSNGYKTLQKISEIQKKKFKRRNAQGITPI